MEATSSPTVELAMELAQKAFIPKLTLRHWIEQASVDEQLISVVQVKNIDELKKTDPEQKNKMLQRVIKRIEYSKTERMCYRKQTSDLALHVEFL